MLIKTMGLLLFTVGLVLIVLSILVIFGTLSLLGPIERWVVFTSGTILCIIGYLMARTEEELVLESGGTADHLLESQPPSELQAPHQQK